MGNDGLSGAHAIKDNGGRTVVQDEATSIVYGMPKAVVDAGYADTVVSTSRVVPELMTILQQIDEISSEDAVTPYRAVLQE